MKIFPDNNGQQSETRKIFQSNTFQEKSFERDNVTLENLGKRTVIRD